MSRLILFAGKPGTGKTTLSKILSELLGIQVIHKDQIREAYALDGTDYESAGKIAYETVAHIVRTCLSNNIDLIVDSSCTKAYHRGQLRAIASNCNAVFIEIECYCSSYEIHMQRIEKRKLPPFRVVNREKYVLVAEKFEPFKQPDLRVDTMQPVEACLDDVLELLMSRARDHKVLRR